jgi:type VI protein secretion system component VasF
MEDVVLSEREATASQEVPPMRKGIPNDQTEGGWDIPMWLAFVVLLLLALMVLGLGLALA